MKLFFTNLLFLIFLSSGFSQLNMTLQSQVEYDDDGNDVWGYVAPNGDEYAIVGTRNGTRVYSLEDITNPIERINIPGSSSTWRDIKFWGEHVYVTCDSGTDGLLIINMEGAPENIEYNFIKPIVDEIEGSDTTQISLNRCHNIYIDENGIIYLAGCEGRGVEFFDADANPSDPVYLGSIQSPYSHDAYAKGDTLYASEIYDHLAIYDVSDKTDVKLLGTRETSSDFAHNAWADPTHNFAFTTDERPEGYLDSYDVSDPGNIEFLDKFLPPGKAGTGTIPHNTHYYNGFLVTSWYTSGVIVVDGNKPDNLVQVAQYDTYDGPDGGFSGCWGVTPYLPSGILLVNDINSGFYVFDIDYVRASYLEGNITNAVTGESISNATVSILEGDLTDVARSTANGDYKTGQATPGSFMVEYAHPEYYNDTLTVNLSSGEVTIQDVSLTPLPKFTPSIKVIDSISKSPIPNAKLLLRNEGTEYEFSTNDSGETNTTIFAGDYEVFVGAWGYKNYVYNLTIDSDMDQSYEIAPSYMDDFILDLDWEVINEEEPFTNFTGAWERAIPIETSTGNTVFSPGEDVQTDIGNMCYVTENGGGSYFDYDVDNGETFLISPVMDLTEYENPTIEIRAWWVALPNQGTASDDFLRFYLSNGIDEELVLVYDEFSQNWSDIIELVVLDYLEVTDNMRLKISISDYSNSGNVVEAGIDNFFVRGYKGIDSANKNVISGSVEIFPNPSSDLINISSSYEIIANVEIFDITGRKVLERSCNSKNEVISINQLHTGNYNVRVISEKGHALIKKISVIK